MQKRSKFLIGVQIGVLMTAVALPVQAAVNIGAPQSLPGSVVILLSYVSTPTIMKSTSSPSPSQSQQINVGPSPSYYSGNVVSLNNFNPSTSLPATSTPSSSSVSVPAQIKSTQTTVSVPNTTYIQNPTVTYPSQPINIAQPNLGGSVVSLKNINSQSASVPVAVTSTPVPAPTTTSPTATSTTPSTNPSLPVIPAVTVVTADEQLMVDMINQERIAAGVSPVKLDLRLASVGRAKANDLKANNYFDHNSPTYGSPWAMMQQVGLTVGWAGENLSGNKSVEGSMAALMLSPGHKANILDPRFTHVGVGIAAGSAYGNLYVQEFLQE